jgi:cholesterol oxidase
MKSELPVGGMPTFLREANDCAHWIAERTGGIAASSYSEVLMNRPVTAHVLGGCPMGSGPDQGVVDKYGRVFGHDGLIVADGSIVCANLGVNPSLTITALSEHIMSAIPKKGERPSA